MSPSQNSVLTRCTLIYAILVGGLPVLQGAAFLSGGWTESMLLLAMYLFVPLAGVWLVQRAHPRPGAILLLGFMSSGIVINGLLFEGLIPPAFASPIWFTLLRAWILGLIVVQVIIGWLSFRLLREIHRPADSTNQSPQA